MDALTMSELTDAAIVHRVRAGERNAYGELVERYQNELRTNLSVYFHTREDLEEQLQNAFVQAYLKLDTYDPSAAFLPWLKRIALNNLRMEFRRLEVTRRRGLDYLRYVQLQRAAEGTDFDEISAQATALRNCLEKLDATDAAIVRAKYEAGAPIRDLSLQYQTTEGAMKVRLLRARNLLRLCIEKTMARAEGV